MQRDKINVYASEETEAEETSFILRDIMVNARMLADAACKQSKGDPNLKKWAELRLLRIYLTSRVLMETESALEQKLAEYISEEEVNEFVADAMSDAAADAAAEVNGNNEARRS